MAVNVIKGFIDSEFDSHAEVSNRSDLSMMFYRERMREMVKDDAEIDNYYLPFIQAMTWQEVLDAFNSDEAKQDVKKRIEIERILVECLKKGELTQINAVEEIMKTFFNKKVEKKN